MQAPKANAYCERLMGTIRRECLDYVIPLSEQHLRTILREWVTHYNQGRPHASLGPGIPSLEEVLVAAFRGLPLRAPSYPPSRKRSVSIKG